MMVPGGWNPISAPLDHLIAPPRTVSETCALLVLLHGRGADAHDLLPLANELGREDLLVVSPQAPYALPGPFGIGYAWYDMHDIGDPDPVTFEPSLARLREFIDEVVAGYPVDADRVFLLGFSQGAVMSLATASTDPRRLAGVVALSGYLPESVVCAEGGRLDDLPVFIGHGNADPLIPVTEGHKARDVLIAKGADVTYREYSVAHRIAPEELNDIRGWLNARLDAAPPREPSGRG
ncbi:MAG: alpha/beta fold hydrolase [Chloroflexi bacterium]|nr:alpha/beta fold hydrolase [Chloroflexota bacterium]